MNEWISVKDRLPDPKEHDEVIIFQYLRSRGTNKLIPHFSIEYSEKIRMEKGCNTAWCDEPKDEITHWQPLPKVPEPPKGE